MTSSSVGERVAAYRRQRGMSQRELAAAVRRSESWVGQVERDVQPVERLSVLQALASALGVSVRDLRPEALDEDSTDSSSAVNDLDGVRLAISGHPALSDLFVSDQVSASLAIEDLHREVDRAWELAHADRFAELSTVVTDLLPQLERAVRAATKANRRRIHALLARTYQAVAAAFARQDEADAAWVASDRAIAAAELAGDPLAVIAGHFRLAHAFLRLQRYDQAERVIATALSALQPLVDQGDAPAEVLSLYGATHLVQAVASAHESDRAKAHQHLELAESIGTRLGEDRNDYETEFGPTNVQLHRVAVAVDLGDAGEALEIASRIDASSLSPERQARFLVDIARAHAQRRQIGDATAALVEADQLAPEHVRAHHHAREALETLLAQAGRRPPPALLELAQRAGVAA